mmetsp:Transcript_46260/g.76504  ORF Transcript_46260/g.76504 Transcript_46260/m.76504 type:complete len:140 (+) Transcript_46260:260-679(+)
MMSGAEQCDKNNDACPSTTMTLPRRECGAEHACSLVEGVLLYEPLDQEQHHCPLNSDVSSNGERPKSQSTSLSPVRPWEDVTALSPTQAFATLCLSAMFVEISLPPAKSPIGTLLSGIEPFGESSAHAFSEMLLSAEGP